MPCGRWAELSARYEATSESTPALSGAALAAAAAAAACCDELMVAGAAGGDGAVDGISHRFGLMPIGAAAGFGRRLPAAGAVLAAPASADGGVGRGGGKKEAAVPADV